MTAVRHDRKFFAEPGYYRTYKDGLVTGYFRFQTNAENFANRAGGTFDESMVFIDDEEMAKMFIRNFNLSSDFSIQALIKKNRD